MVAKPQIAAQVGDGDVLALAEMSITGDGADLYFVYLKQVAAGAHDLGIGVAHR